MPLNNLLLIRLRSFERDVHISIIRVYMGERKPERSLRSEKNTRKTNKKIEKRFLNSIALRKNTTKKPLLQIRRLQFFLDFF